MKIISNTKSRIEIEFEEFDAGFVRLIVQELLKDKNIDFAAMKIKHPSNPIPLLVASGKAPKKSLKKALGKIEEDFSKLSLSIPKLK